MVDGGRLIRAFRAWRKVSSGSLSLDRRAWWEPMDREALALGTVCLALAPSIPIEATLWGVGWGPSALREVGRIPGAVTAGFFVGVWLTAAWIFDGLLRRRLAEPCRPRVTYRLLRAAILGLPGFGIASVPFWRTVAAKRWRLVYPRDRGCSSSSLLDEPASIRLAPSRWSGALAVPVWVLGVAVLVIGALWLAAPSDPTLERKTALMAAALGLHLLGLTGSWVGASGARGPGASKWRRFSAMAWLLPLPLSLVALVPIGLDGWGRRSDSLVWKAFARRGQETQLDAWTSLERSLRRSWSSEHWWRRWRRPVGRWVTPQLSALDRRLLGVSRIKLATLACDGLLLSWLLHRSGSQPIEPLPIGGVLVLGTVAMLVGLAVLAVRMLLTLVRAAREPDPLGLHRRIWYGAVAITGLGIGHVAGSILALRSHQEAAMLLVLVAAVVQAFIGLGFVLRAVVSGWNPERSGLGLGWVGVLAVFMIAVASSGPALASTTAVAGLVGHAMVVARVVLYHRWWWPPARGRASRWSRSALLASSLVPFGGLAVPLWLWLRCRREAAAVESEP